MVPDSQSEAPLRRPPLERRRLRNEVAVILVLKTLGLVLLFTLFFAGAARVDPAGVARHLFPASTATQQ